MEILDIETWNRKLHYQHFGAMKDPFFGVTIPFDVSKAYGYSKENPPDGLGCIHCSALPWFSFTGHKEPVSGQLDSVPKLAFGKTEKTNRALKMNVSIHVNHALVDGYDIGLFVEIFQYYLNK